MGLLLVSYQTTHHQQFKLGIIAILCLPHQELTSIM